MLIDWGYIPCSTPGCGHTDVPLSDSLSLAEYRLRSDPAGRISVTCERCGEGKEYDRESLLQLVDPAVRPKPLPPDHHWAILLVEIETAETMKERAFLGERILVKVDAYETDVWRGSLVQKSEFAPDLKVGTELGGPYVNGFHVAQEVKTDNEYEPIQFELKPPPRGSFFAMFFIPKEGNFIDLKVANLFCMNPSCPYVFSKTWSQMEEMLCEAALQGRKMDATTYCMWRCNVCGTTRVVDHTSFDGLFKV